MQVQVQIDEFNDVTNKVVLSMRHMDSTDGSDGGVESAAGGAVGDKGHSISGVGSSGGGGGALSAGELQEFMLVPPDRWMHAQVLGVSSMGLFVRPAGYDAVGEYVIKLFV